MKENTQRVTIWIDPTIAQLAKSKTVKDRTTLSRVIEDLLYSYLGSKREAKAYAKQLGNGKSK